VGKHKRASNIAAIFLPAVAIGAIVGVGLFLGGYIQYILAISFVAIMCATALVLLVGLARIITLAAGAMMGLGAYSVGLLLLHFEVPYLIGVLAGAVVGAVGGLVLSVPATRFRGHHLAMVTLVFQFVVFIVLRQWASLTGGAQGLRVPQATILGFPLTTDWQYLLVIGAATAAVVILVAVLARGHFGKSLRAISATEIGAEAFGIDIAGFQRLAFVLSSALIAFAGAVQAPHIRILDPEAYGIIRSVLLLAYPIVGGMTSVWGGILGGGIMTYLPEALRVVAEYKELVYACLVLAIIVTFPGGIVEIVQRAYGVSKRASKPSGERPKSDIATNASAASSQGSAVAPATAPDRPVSNETATALEISDVFKSYGALVAVNNANLKVETGTIHGLIGPNGAGKTTLFNLVSGFISPDHGQIKAFGTAVAGEPARERIAIGLTRTFQHVAVFGSLSCLDNVILGLGRNGVMESLRNSFEDALALRRYRQRRELAFEALSAVGLQDLAFERAGVLSLGNQRRLEIARAIVSQPRLLLLDEPVSGLETDELSRLHDLLLHVNARAGITMLIIEHNVRFVADLCQTMSVMNAGTVIAEGKPDEIIALPEVRRVYFGDSTDAA